MVRYMDDDNTLIVDKTRCSYYTGKAVAKPSEKDFIPFCDWLKGSAPAVKNTAPQVQAPVSSPTITEEQPVAPPQGEDIPEPVQQMWRRMSNLNGICEVFAGLRNELTEALGEENGPKSYQVLLAIHGVENPNQFRSVQKARQCAWQMWMKMRTVRRARTLQH